MARPQVSFEVPRFNHKLGLATTILYGLAFMFGFFVAVPTGIVLRGFHGRCILFAQIVWDNSMIWPWRELTCDFVLYWNIAVNIFYAAFLFLFMLLMIWPRYRSSDSDKVGLIGQQSITFVYRGINKVMTMVNVIIVFVMLCTAFLVTIGFVSFCNSLIKTHEKEGEDSMSCASASKATNWNMLAIEGGSHRGVNGGHFYSSMVVATLFSWVEVVIWVLLLVLNFKLGCEGCTCDLAEEKQKDEGDKLARIAMSRAMTPGTMTPRAGGGIPLQQPPPGNYPTRQPYYGRPY